ncbi:hypothetical protein Bca4012_019457 [Brassica carinata]
MSSKPSRGSEKTWKVRSTPKTEPAIDDCAFKVPQSSRARIKDRASPHSKKPCFARVSEE